MSQDSVSYREAGVDYDALDAGKRLAMSKALSTSALLAARGGHALDASRGEPAFVFELDGRAFAFVVEGLGTKSIIARTSRCAMMQLSADTKLYGSTPMLMKRPITSVTLFA